MAPVYDRGLFKLSTVMRGGRSPNSENTYIPSMGAGGGVGPDFELVRSFVRSFE